MRRVEIATGTKYGDMEVLGECAPTLGKRCFRCRCECGREVEVRLDHLRSGHSTSCGKCGLEHNGERKTLRAWAESVGLKESTLRARLKTMRLGEALRRQ